MNTYRTLVIRGILLGVVLGVCSISTDQSVQGYEGGIAELTKLQAANVAEANNVTQLQDGVVAAVPQGVITSSTTTLDASVRLPNGSTYRVDAETSGTTTFAAAGSHGTVFVPESSTLVPAVATASARTASGGAQVEPILDQLLSNQKSVPAIIQIRTASGQFGASGGANASPKFSSLAAARSSIVQQLELAQEERVLDLPLLHAFATRITLADMELLSRDAGIERILYDAPAQVTLDTSLNDIHVPEVWPAIDASNATVTGSGIRIAILDSGIDYRLPDFGGCFGPGCRVVGGYDFVNSDSDPMDDHGHGTHVAGTAAGKGQVGSTLLYGVAPDATLYAYKVCNSSGSCASSAVVAALGYATDPNRDTNTSDHVDVASLSLGGSGNPDDAMSLAVDAATAAGVTVTVAAGNTGSGASTIQSPGSARTAITVAAACKPGDVGVNGYCTQAIASFSSRGPYVYNSVDLQKPDVAAPGVNICAAQWGTAFATTSSNCFDQHHIRLNGTSMATPHVAGVAALMKQANPSLTPAQIKAALRSTATSLGLSVNAQGAGEVNAAAAINAAIDVTASPSLWTIASNPTTRFTTVDQSISVTAHDLGVGVVDIALANAPSGVSFTPSVSSINLSGNGTASFTASITIDNNSAATGNSFASITFSSGGTRLGAVNVPIQILPTISLSTEQIVDYGVDSPDVSSWTSANKAIIVTNLRTDIPQTVTPSMTGFSASTTANVPGATVISAGGQATLNTSLTNTNAGILNGVYYGRLTIQSGVTQVSVATKFTKFYVINITTVSGNHPMFVVNDIAHNTLLFTYASPIYLAGSGPYDIMIDDTNGANNQTHIIFENQSPTNGELNLTYNQATGAPHRLRMTGKKADGSTGVWSESIRTVLYPATDTVGYWTLTAYPGQEFSSVDEYYSTASNKYKYLTTFPSPDVTKPTDWYLYDVQLLNGISGSVTYAFTPTDLHMAQVVLDAKTLTGTHHPGVYFGSVGTWANLELYSTTTASTVNIYSTMPTGSSTYAGMYGVFSEELPSDCDGNTICPSAALSPLFTIAPSGGQWLQLRPNHWNNRQLQFPLPAPVSTSIYNDLGPLVWYGKFNNTSTRIKYGPYYGEFTPFLRQDFVLQNLAVPNYTVKDGANTTITTGTIEPKITGAYYNAVERDDQYYQDGGLTGFDQTASLGVAGLYHFISSVPYAIDGQSYSGELDATFTTSLPDPNPPSLTRLVHLVNNARTDQYVIGGDNTVQLTYDAVGGIMSSVALSYATDGVTFNPLSVSLSSGVYSATVPNNLAGSTLTLKSLATDSSGNTLTYTWALPFGVSPVSTDVESPMVIVRGLTPNSSLPIFGTVALSADALDNVGVTKVEFLMDGAVVGTDLSAPFTYSLDAWGLAAGSYQIAAKAYDQAGHTTTSWAVPTTKASNVYSLPYTSSTEIDAWVSTNGVWSIGGGVVTAPNSSNPSILRVPSAPVDVQLQTEVRLSGGTQEPGVALRVIDQNNYYFCGMQGNAVRLYKRQSGSWTTLAQATVSSAVMSTWYTVRAQVVGNLLQCTAWPTTDAVPSTWLLTVHDGALATGDAGIGVRANQGVGAPDFDNTVFSHSSVGVSATPSIEFSSSTGADLESVASGSIPVALSATSESDVTVAYAVTGGTASTGSDFTLPSGILTIPAGDLGASIPFSIIDDSTFETDETMIVSLSGPSGAASGIHMTYTYTIQNDDTSPVVAFATASASASESVTSPTLTIVQDNPSIATTTVSYAVTGGTGSTADYSLAGGSVTIPAGSTSTTIPLVITNDTMYELDETLVLTLSSPINAALGPQTTLTYTIVNDDAIPTMRVARTTSSGDEGVASANIGIELSHPSYLDSSAALGISGTATRGNDYVVLPVTVSIPAGQTSANILLSVVDDTEIEAAETVVFTFSSPVNASLDGSTTTYTIIDNDVVALPPTPAALTLIRPVTTKNLKNGVATTTVWKIVNTGQTISNRITLEARIPKDGKITSAGWKCTVVGAQRRCTKTFNGIVGGGTQNISITVVPSAALAPTAFTVDMYLKSTGVTTQRKAATWKITRYYTVGIGDSLRSIARTAYGRTDRWAVIRQANVKAYPSLIRSVRLLRGWKLLIP